MPVAGRNATLTMAMCPGHALQTSAPANVGTPNPARHGQPVKKAHEAPCIYAATAGGAPPLTFAAAVLVATSQDALVLPPVVAPVARQIPRAHPPRAPPALV
jgi:hypothetical protein